MVACKLTMVLTLQLLRAGELILQYSINFSPAFFLLNFDANTQVRRPPVADHFAKNRLDDKLSFTVKRFLSTTFILPGNATKWPICYNKILFGSIDLIFVDYVPSVNTL